MMGVDAFYVVMITKEVKAEAKMKWFSYRKKFGNDKYFISAVFFRR